MTMQLRGIPCSLEKLALHLNEESDIQEKIMSLISDARDLSGMFIYIMAKNGTEVLSKKYALMTVSNPSKVEVQNLKMALKAMQDELQTVRDDMFVFQASVHTNIEECRARIWQHKNTIAIEKIKTARLRNEIKDLEQRISDCETEAMRQDESADRCEENARKFSRQADEIRKLGLKTSGVVAGLGILFAPFTGGLSIAAAGFTVAGSLGAAGYKSLQWDETARNHRQIAHDKRSEVERYRQAKYSLEKVSVGKEIEVTALEKKNDRLSMTCVKLEGTEKQLLTAISIIDILTKNVQDLDTTLYDTERQGDSFRIIQNAFNRNPEKLEGRAQHYLKELKEKWEIVEQDIEETREFRSLRN